MDLCYFKRSENGSFEYKSRIVKRLEVTHEHHRLAPKKPRTGILVRDDVEYGSFATTHFCLSYLAELGLDRNHEMLDMAANRYLDLQKPDGDWWEHLSCLNGYNIRTFILLGYRDDIRVQKTIDLMMGTARKDGGTLCDLHEKPNRRPQKSCVRGSAKALLAYSVMPEYRDTEQCKELVEYFLKRQGIYQNKNLNEYVNKDVMSESLADFLYFIGGEVSALKDELESTEGESH